MLSIFKTIPNPTLTGEENIVCHDLELFKYVVLVEYRNEDGYSYGIYHKLNPSSLVKNLSSEQAYNILLFLLSHGEANALLLSTYNNYTTRAEYTTAVLGLSYELSDEGYRVSHALKSRGYKHADKVISEYLESTTTEQQHNIYGFILDCDLKHTREDFDKVTRIQPVFTIKVLTKSDAVNSQAVFTDAVNFMNTFNSANNFNDVNFHIKDVVNIEIDNIRAIKAYHTQYTIYIPYYNLFALPNTLELALRY